MQPILLFTCRACTQKIKDAFCQCYSDDDGAIQCEQGLEGYSHSELVSAMDLYSLVFRSWLEILI